MGELLSQGRAPESGKELDAWFLHIVADGTGKAFATEHNARWPAR